jgi:hypothetical protein
VLEQVRELNPRAYVRRVVEGRTGWSEEAAAILRDFEVTAALQSHVVRAVLLGAAPGRSGPIERALRRLDGRLAEDWRRGGGVSMITEIGDSEPLTVGLVLLRGFGRQEGAELRIEPSDLEGESWMSWLPIDAARIQRLSRSLESIVAAIPVPLVLGPMPDLVHTADVGDEVRTWDQRLTLGARAQHNSGKMGFLTAAHGFTRFRSLPFPWSGSRVDIVDGTRGRATHLNRIWDAAFVECRQPIGARQRPVRTRLEAIALPSGATFSGATSGSVSCEVSAADPIIPLFHVGYATGVARIYTNACTREGDSGAVLMTTEGEAIGQASLTTTPGQPLAFSVWTWMAGVEAALGVRVF